jgi:asparagine synthase (glutamine-hydrolysing)
VHRISDEEIFKSIPAYIACMDQPSADGFNTFIISKFAAENEIKVLLSGIGADELFAGYTSFWKTNFLTKYSNIINIYIKYFLHKNDLYKSKFFKLNTLNNISEYRDSYILQRSINHQTEKYFNLPFGNSLITPELWDRMMVDDRWSNFHRIVFFESVFYMLNQLLRDADIFSSANSVEIRTPFLDLDLFETSMSIASKNHIIFSNGKRILNSILLKNAPNYIIHKKKGFVVPISGIFEKPKFLKKIKEVIDSKEHYEGTGMKVQDGQNLISNYLKYKNEIYLSKIWSLFILLSWNNLRLEKA